MAVVFQGYFSSRTKKMTSFLKNTRLSFRFVRGPEYRIIEGLDVLQKVERNHTKGESFIVTDCHLIQ